MSMAKIDSGKREQNILHKSALFISIEDLRCYWLPKTFLGNWDHYLGARTKVRTMIREIIEH